MKIKKGTLLNVSHIRKGDFTGMATKDFDTDDTEFYPIALAQRKPIQGLSVLNTWVEGEEIPCRHSLCTVTIRSS